MGHRNPAERPWLDHDVPVVLVAAHPDDETLGFAGQLGFPLNITFLYSTDGAPRDMRDAHALGFERAGDYAQARSQELHAALQLTALREIRIRNLGIPDQEAAYHVLQIAESLLQQLDEIRPAVILTHPFEGGHPDHDATALAVQLAVRNGHSEALLMEFTSYHLEDGQLVAGRFLNSSQSILRIPLTPDEYSRKERMVSCFATQSSFIQPMLQSTESFRVAPRYDFTARPHDGPLFYETWPSGMRWEQWLECVEAILRIA